MRERLAVRVLAVCLAVSLVGNVWMVMENRRLLSEWTPPSAAMLQVHVLGAVLQPGVYSLPSGSRVADALERAGGVTALATLGQTNLAKPLFDGEQVLVESAAPAAASAQASPADSAWQQPVMPQPAVGGLINVNTATAAELDSLPYIGPSKAAAIIAYRQEHGAFSAVSDLLKVPGIGEATLAKFKHLVIAR